MFQHCDFPIPPTLTLARRGRQCHTLLPSHHLPLNDPTSCGNQAPQATAPLAHDVPPDAIAKALSELQPIQSAGVVVEVQQKGPFVGGGHSWSIAFKPAESSASGDEFAALVSTFPTVGVQEANVTGTGARVKVERRDAQEAPPVEHMVSLAAPLPPETLEVQVVGCYLVDRTPSEAALAGASFVLVFRGEQTEVRVFLADRGRVSILHLLMI